MAKNDEVEGLKTLSTREVSELFLYFKQYIREKQLDYETLIEHFMPGTDTFVSFILSLEVKLKWFDYTQAVETVDILDLYLHTLEHELRLGE